MSNRPIMVLLVGEVPRSSVELLLWFYERGCRCHFATSYRDASSLISRTQFDLVLSQYWLPDRTALSLSDWLLGSPATLFLSTVAESGCLWLPVLELGKRCVGAALLRPNAFNQALAKMLGAECRSDEMETVGYGAIDVRDARPDAPYPSPETARENTGRSRYDCQAALRSVLKIRMSVSI
jgi:CheY-like chemotaxis protein